LQLLCLSSDSLHNKCNAHRGLNTALIEREDFASGTSSRSTKMVHGGVRYLEKAVFKLDYGQLQLVYEGLHERDRLLSNAAHLARPLPILTVSVNCLCAASPPLVFVSCELCVCFMWRMSVLFV